VEARKRRLWKPWEKISFAVVLSLLVVVCSCAALGALVGGGNNDPGDNLPSISPTPTGSIITSKSQEVVVTPGSPAPLASNSAKKTQGPTTTKRPAATEESRPPSVYYANCDAVRAAGKSPLYRGQPGYRFGLDRDKDGVACE
jgi:hypothetical protein